MGIFFVSIFTWNPLMVNGFFVSVPYGDLFCFYSHGRMFKMKKLLVSVPYGDLFCFYATPLIRRGILLSFRPLWGSFLFLYCPMETLPGIEKTCTLRCKKFSPAKSGDLKLFKCSVPRFYALRCKTTILLVLSSPSLDHKYDLTE